MSCTRKRGITSGLSATRNFGVADALPIRVTKTSGTTTLRSTSANFLPGLGSKRAIKAIATLTLASLSLTNTAKRLKSRLANISIGCWHILIATSRTCKASAPFGLSALSCSVRHSAKVRAPTPMGSRFCNKCRATWKRCSSSSICSSSSPPKPSAKLRKVSSR